MLIDFSFRNYRSSKNETEITLTAANREEPGKEFIFKTAYAGILPAAVIYGPNSSGKTTIIRALGTMKHLIDTSFKNNTALEESITPFLFDQDTPNTPSEFDISFIAEDVRYQYGFIADKKRIYSEWLYSFPNIRPLTLFTRDYDKTSKDYIYKFGRSYKGEKTKVKELTAENSLLLSMLSRTKITESIEPVLNWFEKLTIIGVSGVSKLDTAFNIHKNKLDKKAVIQFLSSADIDITDLEIKEINFNIDQLPQNISPALRNELNEKFKDALTYEVDILHKVGSVNYKISMDEESSGAKKVFAYAGAILETLKNGGVLIVDELNNHLHPLMVEYILKKFGLKNQNPNKAQIVFSTHDASILNSDVLRRDQIWFCERDSITLSTKITSLLEYKARSNENYERAYLSGRYAAIPIISL